MSNIGTFLDRMSKDFIDRNQLLQQLDLMIEDARKNNMDAQYINGLKASRALIRMSKSEY